MNKNIIHFQTTTHAKWILTGEHSVLRQGDAIVFPLLSKTLSLAYQKQPHALCIQLPKEVTKILSSPEPLYKNIIKHGLHLLKQHEQALTGILHFNHTIPVGMGLGFSAALCIALARLFVWKGWLEPTHVSQFSKKLENFLHGISSGIDIIGSDTNVPIYYNGGEQRPIKLSWQPIIYLSHSQKKSLTAHCITKVQRALQQDPELASVLDHTMHYSTRMAYRALTNKNPKEGQAQLVAAIEQACQCFQQWQLIPKEVRHHIEVLKKNGALAAKPTGAGNGGYVLSLWQTPLPPKHALPFECIATHLEKTVL